ncbi:MAG: undecaprenyldiphospho-muramoylpentapeptide beta-N-acetylglucosaminyltransferase, partial [Actinomycetota bacterium]
APRPGRAPQRMRVVVAGGGTAGHVNPALALALALAGDEVIFVGTTRGAEARLVPQAGFAFEAIEVRGFDRSRPATLVPTAILAGRAGAAALRLLGRLRPDVVVGMGGYVSLPVCLAAAARRMPVVLHEQNAVLGLANRVCKPLARRVAVSFEETLGEVGSRGIVVGNPVLPGIAEIDRTVERKRGQERFGLDPARRTLLVFGGSQGAERINRAAAGLSRLWPERSDRQIVHIAGRARSGLNHAASDDDDGGLVYRVVDFVEHMGEAYSVADLALCRGGATTVAELCVVGLPSIIVPYPFHRDRQQERHGRALERAGAAVVLDDEQTTPERVATEVEGLLSEDEELERMQKAARALGRPDAAQRLADVVGEAA